MIFFCSIKVYALSLSVVFQPFFCIQKTYPNPDVSTMKKIKSNKEDN